jgi:hypothetical protein
MQAPLIRLAATIAGDAPVVVFGLDDAPTLDVKVASPLLALSEAGARFLVGLLGRGEPLTDELLAAETGVDANDLASTVAVLIPGRGTGWTTTDAAVLAAALERRFAAVVMTGRPIGLAQSPRELDAILRRATASPLFTGSLPPDDALAPGGSVAIMQRLEDGPEARVTALLRVRNDEATLGHTLRWLTGEGIAAIVVDGGSTDGSVAVAETWLGRGVVSIVRGGTEAEASFLEVASAAKVAHGWLLRVAANERIEGPWPEIGLRRTLGRFTAAGWDSVSSTKLVEGSGPGDDGRVDFGLGPRPWRFALPDPTVRPVARLTGVEPARRAPYNLLVRSYPVGGLAGLASGRDVPSVTASEWEPWDEDAREQYMVERLTGHGIFRRRYPPPRGGFMFIEERLIEWETSLLKGTLGRLPSPDPLAPEPGVVRVEWSTPDGSVASLFVGRESEDGEFAGRSGASAVTVDGIEPNETYVARLYADETRSRLLAEMRFGVRMEFVT